MSLKLAILVLTVSLFQLSGCTPLETNCTSVKSIDGSDGVDCERIPQPADRFEPTIIQQHFVDLFTRAKRDTIEESDKKPIVDVLSDLFIQNLAVMAQANMTECMNRVNCEEKCQLITSGIFRETADDEKLQGLDELPDFVRSFYEAGMKGIVLGRTKQCADCMPSFPNCNDMQYDYTIKTNDLYKDLMQENVSLFEESDPELKLSPEIEYLHHSMRFLDLANLSRCYARVSCESTCNHVKAEPNSEAPPLLSPLLQNDPQKPASVDIIHEGAVLGYNLAFNGVCNACAQRYADCTPDKYFIAHTSSIIFG